MRIISTNQAQKEAIINENTLALNQAATFGWRVQASTGLQFAYWGGNFQDAAGALIPVGDGVITLTASATNYIYWNPTTAVIAVSTTVPGNGMLRLAKVITNTTGINTTISNNPTDERIFALIPVGTPPSLASSSGGNPNLTALADYEIIGITGFQVTLKAPQAYMALPMEYTSTFIQQVGTNPVLTLPASSAGYIVMDSGSSTCSVVTGTTWSTRNVLGILYRWQTNASGITTLIDTSRSNFTRIVGSGYEQTIALSGNLSKANAFTSAWTVQNATGNFSTSYNYWAFLKCTSAELGYTVGSTIPIMTGPTGGEATGVFPATIRTYGTNGTQVNVITGAACKAQAVTGSVGTYFDVDPTKWSMVVRFIPIR